MSTPHLLSALFIFSCGLSAMDNSSPMKQSRSQTATRSWHDEGESDEELAGFTSTPPTTSPKEKLRSKTVLALKTERTTSGRTSRLGGIIRSMQSCSVQPETCKRYAEDDEDTAHQSPQTSPSKRTASKLLTTPANRLSAASTASTATPETPLTPRLPGFEPATPTPFATTPTQPS